MYIGVILNAKQNFCLTVAVPVVTNTVPLLVRTRQHVGTQVYPPQAVAVDVVAVKVMKPYFLRNVANIAARTLDDKLTHTVAVKVAKADVVHCIVAAGGIAVAIHRLNQVHPLVSVAPTCYCWTFFLFHALDDCGHLIFGRGVAAVVVEVRL